MDNRSKCKIQNHKTQWIARENLVELAYGDTFLDAA